MDIYIIGLLLPLILLLLSYEFVLRNKILVAIFLLLYFFLGSIAVIFYRKEHQPPLITMHAPEWPPDRPVPRHIPRKESEIHGWLVPAKDPTPPNGCDGRPVPQNGVLFLVGNTSVINDEQIKLPVVKVGGCQLLRMQHGPKGILIDADVFSDTGVLIARVQNNEFNLIPGQYSYRQRPDRHTLIVFDRQGKELLWVRFLNPNAVKIRGVFICPDNPSPIIFDDKGIHFFEGSSENHIDGTCAAGNHGPAFSF